MTLPSTPRDRVETSAQASGGNDLVDEPDTFCAGKAGDGDEELLAALAALEQAGTIMVSVVRRAQDQSETPLTYEDMQGPIDEFHAALNRVTEARRSSFADVVAEKEAPENARAGTKRGSDSVTRRFTGEGNRPAPAGRTRDDGATTMDVNGDGAFAKGQKGTCTTVATFSALEFSRILERTFSRDDPRDSSRVGLPAFAHSAATRDVRDGAERARVLVTLANHRASDMASRYASTPQ